MILPVVQLTKFYFMIPYLQVFLQNIGKIQV